MPGTPAVAGPLAGPPTSECGSETAPDSDLSARAGLDPVDLALLMKAQAGPSTARATARRRYVSLVVMGVVFVVLMVLGIVMLSHVHVGTSGTSGVVGAVRALAAASGSS